MHGGLPKTLEGGRPFSLSCELLLRAMQMDQPPGRGARQASRWPTSSRLTRASSPPSSARQTSPFRLLLALASPALHLILICCLCCAQVRQGLRSKQWDTRVAAGECLGLIAEHCEHHTPAELLKAAGVVDSVKAEPGDHANGANPGSHAGGEADAPLSFQNFRIEQVMDKGSLLLASGGTVRLAFWKLRDCRPLPPSGLHTLAIAMRARVLQPIGGTASPVCRRTQ